MATYSGLFNGFYVDGVLTKVGVPLVFNDSEIGQNLLKMLGKLGKRGRGGRVLNELLVELTGTAVGAATLVQRKRVTAVTPLATLAGGGSVLLQTDSDLNRVTVAADPTLLDANLQITFAPTSYPADRSGNGGGSKIGGLY